MRPHRRPRALLALLLAPLANASAQPDPFAPPRDPFAPPPAPAPGPPSPARAPGPASPAQPAAAQPTVPTTVEQMVPQLRSGARAESLRLRQRAIPVVVIVPDAPSYVRALEAWTPLERFPVLIDDSSRAAREDIARFVRAFQPRRVVRWNSDDPPALPSSDSVRAACENALRAVWNFGTDAHPSLADAVRAACEHEAPGVAVASGSDPAWTAGLALAVGRGQPIIWIDAPRGVSAELTKDQGDALCASVQDALTSIHLSWQEIGDAIDTVALCLNTPASVAASVQGQRLALTDRLGHFSDQQTDTRVWGWASQIHGSEAQAAYRAMCALFLELDSAWLFDTYPAGQPWDSYALRFAAQVLAPPQPDDQPPTFGVTLHERPNNGVARWRMATASPLTDPLLMVNTHGLRNLFEFTDGTGFCGDIPMLGEPAAVHFIHSFSAAAPADRNTLAGRWFERGVFAYAGAVHEPYLQSFVPPVALASRLKAGAAWAVACRTDSAPAWKIALFGDPLLCLGPRQERSEAPLPLEGARPVEDSMRDAVRAGRLTDAVADLVLMGRDDQASRLIAAARRADASRLTPELAIAALPAVLRAGVATPAYIEDFYALYRVLPDTLASDPENRDLLWLAARRAAPADGSVIGVLLPHVRPEQRTPDMTELALHAAAARQRDAAIALLTDYRRSVTDQAQLRHIDRAMQIIRGR